MRRAHPDSFNQELEARYEGDQRVEPWTDEDYVELARRELTCTGRHVNQFLMPFYPDRTLDFIKNRRRTTRYKEILQQLRGQESGPSREVLDVFREMSESVAQLVNSERSRIQAAGT